MTRAARARRSTRPARWRRRSTPDARARARRPRRRRAPRSPAPTPSPRCSRRGTGRRRGTCHRGAGARVGDRPQGAPVRAPGARRPPSRRRYRCRSSGTRDRCSPERRPSDLRRARPQRRRCRSRSARRSGGRSGRGHRCATTAGLGVLVICPKSPRCGSSPSGPKEPMPMAAKPPSVSRQTASSSTSAASVASGVVVGTRVRRVIVEPRASTARAFVPPSSTPAMVRSSSTHAPPLTPAPTRASRGP